MPAIPGWFFTMHSVPFANFWKVFKLPGDLAHITMHGSMVREWNFLNISHFFTYFVHILNLDGMPADSLASAFSHATWAGFKMCKLFYFAKKNIHFQNSYRPIANLRWLARRSQPKAQQKGLLLSYSFYGSLVSPPENTNRFSHNVNSFMSEFHLIMKTRHL